MVVVEIEADFADGGNPRLPREILEGRSVARGIEVLRLVRMDAHGGPDVRVACRERGGRAGIRERRPGHEEPGNARDARPREQRLRVDAHLQVAVGVGERRQAT